jgi:sugar phosphate isomerase/epimerase
MAALSECPRGPYQGFTLAELLAERDRYKAARKQAGSRISSVSVNGSSTSFAPERADWSLDTWGRHIFQALHWIDSETYEAPIVNNARSVR